MRVGQRSNSSTRPPRRWGSRRSYRSVACAVQRRNWPLLTRMPISCSAAQVVDRVSQRGAVVVFCVMGER